MVRRALRSRSYRKVQVRVTSGTVTRYLKRNPKAAHCAQCGTMLKGVPRARPFKMQNMPLTKKRPQRAYGGMLCAACSRQKIKDAVRLQ